MSRDLNLNLCRSIASTKDLSNRLIHKKQCAIGTTRVKNKLVKAVELSHQLIVSGRLKAEGEVETITSMSRLEEYMEKVKENGIYVLDLETTGLDVFNDVLVGVCLYTPNMPSAYVPLNHTDTNNHRLEGQLDENFVMAFLKPYITDINIKTITHNGKYDGKVLKANRGWTIGNFYFDTLIGGHLLNEDERHGLKELYWKYCKKCQGSNEDFNDYFGDTPFNYIPIEVATVYGANDGYKNYELYEFQAQFINKDSDREDFRQLAHCLHDIEQPLIPILIDMELRGVQIRKDFSEDLAIEFRGELEATELLLDEYVYTFIDGIMENSELVRLTGGTGKINYNSVGQLQALFYDVWKLKSPDRKEPRGTGKAILEGFIEQAKKKLLRVSTQRAIDKANRFIGFMETLLEYRFCKKMLTTYVEKIPRIIEPKTDAVHTNFGQTGTATGRFNSSHPLYKLNLQNIPSKEVRIRKMFKARDGYVFIGGDFSQIEPRVLARLSGDEVMIDAYNNGKDLYALMASKVYGMPVEECMEFRNDGTLNKEGKKRRTSMKSVLLGIMYSRGARSIAEQLGISLVEAEELINSFNREFPKVERYRKYCVHHGETYGYVTMMHGRKRRLPNLRISDHEDYKYQEAFRQCLNSVIQGSAGIILKLAMIEIGNSEEFKRLDGNLLLTIHDELICEVKEEYAEEGRRLLEDMMKEVGQRELDLAMKVDCEVSRVWTGE